MQTRYILVLAAIIVAPAHATTTTKLIERAGSVVQTWTGCSSVTDQLTPGYPAQSSLVVGEFVDHFTHIDANLDSWIVVAGNTYGMSKLPNGSVVAYCAFISHDTAGDEQTIVIGALRRKCSAAGLRGRA